MRGIGMGSARAASSDRTVLLVDDDSADVQVVRDVVGANHSDVDLQVVSGGDEALAYLTSSVDDGDIPDLVLLDSSLPDGACREVLEAIKTDPLLARVPVVVLSRSGSDEDTLPFYRRYANAVLQKPDDPEAYADVLRSLERFWLSVVRLPRSFA